MQLRALKLLEDLRTSYWFVPALMAFAALILGAGVIYVDASIGSDWLDSLSWYQANKPDGAQEVLSTIAGSAITVAGVVFSITIVSVSYAASQYGPRVLTNFMSDRGNQVTLGTFIATFLYCLVVLRTIRGGDEGDFVPDLAIILALVLALASIAVLIFFIHHVPHSIHVNTVVAGIGRELIESIGDRFPEFIGKPPDAERRGAEQPASRVERSIKLPGGTAGRVCSGATGYIEAIDDALLMEIACRHDLIIRLGYRPGEFIHAGRCYAEVWPISALTEEIEEALRDTFAVSNRRTPLQDTRFLVDELVEVGTRALSPGVNDPFTAITCLDWIGTALSEVAVRKLPHPHRLDGKGDIRVIAAPMTFQDYVEQALGQFRQYLASDQNAALHAFRTVERVAEACGSRKQIEALVEEVEALRSAAGEILTPSLFGKVDRRGGEVVARLRALADAPRERGPNQPSDGEG